MTVESSASSQKSALFERAARTFVDEYWSENLIGTDPLISPDSSGDWLAQAHRDTVHIARSLALFVESGPVVEQTHFLRHLMVLPITGPVAAAMPPVDGMEFIVIGRQFIDVLKFHYQATAGFKLAEFLIQTGAPLPSHLVSARAVVYWAASEWVHEWFRTGGAVPNLSGLVASPLSLNLESDAFLEGLLFMVLHECGHFALEHVTKGPNDVGVASFRQISKKLMTEEQRQELAADAWAIQSMAWLNPTWQCAAIVRLFLFFGVAHAALGTHTPEHPYLQDRSAHLMAALQAHDVPLTPHTLRLPEEITAEYEYRSHKPPKAFPPTNDENLALLATFLQEVSHHFKLAGGDAALLAWMQSQNITTRPW